MAWIGGLKFVPYEAESIVPFVANSPVMKCFYAKPAPEYKQYMNKEGERVPKNRAWHQKNRTYLFADALGTVIIGIGILVLLGSFSPMLGFVGALLAAGMSFVTLSFLITTPEAWVSHFPYLAGSGRLVIKDLIMLSAALVCLSSSSLDLLRSKDPQLPAGRGAALIGSTAPHPPGAPGTSKESDIEDASAIPPGDAARVWGDGRPHAGEVHRQHQPGPPVPRRDDRPPSGGGR